MTDLPTIYAHYTADNACTYHRLLQPARFLQPRHPGVRWVVGGDADPPAADCYVTHGMPSRSSLQLVGRWKRRQAVVVYSCDDDYFSLPEWNPVKATEAELDALAAVHSLADLILCSTEGLAETLRRRGHGAKVCVAPNLVDLDRYPAVPPPEPGPGGAVRVLWSGSITHGEDLNGMAEGLAAAMALAPRGTLEVAFLGAAPPHPLLRDWLNKGVLWSPPVAFMDYWRHLTLFAPHVCLAPLAGHTFNYSKSNLRVIESWALHAAVLASPVAEYGSAVDHCRTGVHLRSAAEWRDAVLALLAKPERRREIAAAGRQEVERRWAWQSDACHAPWDEFLARVLGLVRRRG